MDIDKTSFDDGRTKKKKKKITNKRKISSSRNMHEYNKQKIHRICNYDFEHVVIRMRIIGASSSAIISSTGEGDFL